MRFCCAKFLLPFFLAAVLVISKPAVCDAGVFTGNGQNLHQITSKTIQLVSIDVTILLGRGPFLYDGTVRGMDRAEYTCEFVLHNLSAKDEDVQIGFPVDSEFARGVKQESPDESKGWVFDYGFIARDEKTTYNVEFVRRKPKSAGEFGSIFTWEMHFSPGETRNLAVHYRIHMSMGLVPMQKDERTGFREDVFGEEFLNIGILDTAGYITSTGSSWAGNVEKATFKLLTEPYERYYQRRGVTEQAAVDMNSDEAKQFHSTFPVQHPWWFRQIDPEGWKPIEGGVQWEYKNYKPKDAIQIRYYTTPFPRLPEEVGPFVDRFIKGIRPNEPAATELYRLKEVMLATYGKEPDDPVAKSFVSEQLWYKPRKDFSLDRLGAGQKAILREFDRRIAMVAKQ